MLFQAIQVRLVGGWPDVYDFSPSVSTSKGKDRMAKEVDLLTEVFSTLRLKAQLYFKAELAGEFALEVPQDGQWIRFHLVCRGRCWVKTDAGEEVVLTAGSLAVIPHGARQVLSSRPGLVPLPLAAALEQAPPDESLVLRLGKGEAETHLLCGFCGFDEPVLHPILAHLPGLLVLKTEDLDEEPWIQASLRLMALEADLADQGMRGILTRLWEIALVQIVRRTRLGRDGEVGYMAALRDAGLSRALLSMHTKPEMPWTVDSLARESGMSRARFAQHFAGTVGLPPLEYLTNWRLAKARKLLQTTGLTVEEVAARCGYASLPSFSRRFHAAFQVRPGAFRKQG